MAAATSASGRAAANSGSPAANSSARRSTSGISIDISEPHNLRTGEICPCDAARNEYYVSQGNDIPRCTHEGQCVTHCTGPCTVLDPYRNSKARIPAHEAQFTFTARFVLGAVFAVST